MKKYIDKIINGIDEQITETEGKKNKSNRFYKWSKRIAAVLGTCLLFGTPWFGISLIGAAVSLHFSQKTAEHNLNTTLDHLKNQKNHISRAVSNGIDPREVTSTQKNNQINTLEKKRKKQDEEYRSSIGKQQLLSALVAGTVVATGLLASPWIAIATFGSAWLKHSEDINNMQKHDQLEATTDELNNAINDYNVGVKMIQNSRTNNTRRTPKTQPTQTQARTTTRRHAVPHTNEEEAVDAYLRSLESQPQTTNNTPRRRI